MTESKRRVVPLSVLNSDDAEGIAEHRVGLRALD